MKGLRPITLKPLQMKKIFLTAVMLPAAFGMFLLQGCLKDSYQRTYSYTYYKPVYKTTEEVRANIRSNAARAIERPGKIYIRGSYIFLNEIDMGIHVIDNSNPAQPRNIAFIDIPGNMDIAVKGNMLYADLYTDLVAVDITDPAHAVLKKVVENMFPQRYYDSYFRPDSARVIARWEKRDTTVTERSNIGGWLKSGDIFMSYSAMSNAGQSGASASVSPYGVGGSMARFAIVNERLYTVNTQDLNVVNISNPADPVNTRGTSLGWNIETIYPFMNKLFIGSTSGMFIYQINNPDNPTQVGQFSHVRSCDPVIADNEYAYVTLRSGSACQGFTNELEVLKLNNLTDPALVKIYSMTNPHGLTKDGNLIFICDGQDGLKLYNAENVFDLKLLQQLAGIEAYDVIALGGSALVVATDGLYQYDYSNPSNLRLLSKITISK
jgi:hypothetical protein